jgi:hypothetical protein
MKTNKPGVALVLLGGLCAACGSEVQLGESTGSLVATNGVGLNGVGLNGVSPNGVGLNGVKLNGVGLNGISLNGVGLNGVGLNGTQLYGTDGLTGATISGFGFVGADLTGILSDGTTLPLRIDWLQQGAPPNEDVYFFLVSYLADGLWKPLCRRDEYGAPIPAIPLAGAWDLREGVPGGGSKIDDPTVFTFACRRSALAKCVEMGYKPWKIHSSCEGNGCAISLADHHQACTRAIRADYCGDGTPYTVDGRRINVYDKLRIQLDEANWPFEAEWDVNGALCVSHQRASADVSPPPCFSQKAATKCGKPSQFQNGTLIMTEFDSTR